MSEKRRRSLRPGSVAFTTAQWAVVASASLVGVIAVVLSLVSNWMWSGLASVCTLVICGVMVSAHR